MAGQLAPQLNCNRITQTTPIMAKNAKLWLSGVQHGIIIFGAWIVMISLRRLVSRVLAESPVLDARIGVALWLVWIVVAAALILHWLKTATSVPPPPAD